MFLAPAARRKPWALYMSLETARLVLPFTTGLLTNPICVAWAASYGSASLCSLLGIPKVSFDAAILNQSTGAQLNASAHAEIDRNRTQAERMLIDQLNARCTGLRIPFRHPEALERASGAVFGDDISAPTFRFGVPGFVRNIMQLYYRPLCTANHGVCVPMKKPADSVNCTCHPAAEWPAIAGARLDPAIVPTLRATGGSAHTLPGQLAASAQLNTIGSESLGYQNDIFPIQTLANPSPSPLALLGDNATDTNSTIAISALVAGAEYTRLVRNLSALTAAVLDDPEDSREISDTVGPGVAHVVVMAACLAKDGDADFSIVRGQQGPQTLAKPAHITARSFLVSTAR